MLTTILYVPARQILDLNFTLLENIISILDYIQVALNAKLVPHIIFLLSNAVAYNFETFLNFAIEKL
jgi:hypothetical protein